MDNQSIDGWLPDEVLPCTRCLSHSSHRATRHAGTLLEHGIKWGTSDQKVENGPFFHTKKAHTYTSHVRTLSSDATSQIQTSPPSAPYCTIVLFVLGPSRNCVYAGKRRHICLRNEVMGGRGGGRKGGRGRWMIDWQGRGVIIAYWRLIVMTFR